jgi:MerR family transcriptional regulator, copper efflux regulator
MNIGGAARESGLTSKTIRYYEEIGLVRPARGTNSYRDYDEADVARLRFLHSARGIGFTIEECRQLLSLYEKEDRHSADVKAIARIKLAEIDRKIADMQGLRTALASFMDACRGDDLPECGIIEALAGNGTGSVARNTRPNKRKKRTEP